MSQDSVHPINFKIFIKIEDKNDHVERSLLGMCFAQGFRGKSCFSSANFRADLPMGQIQPAACFHTAWG